jgi:hypothetical protein
MYRTQFRPRAVLKTVIVFVAEYGSTLQERWLCKVLRLNCWNADGMRGRKFEVRHFLNQHDVVICLLSETFPNPGQAVWLVNYVCHRTD